MQHPLRQPVAAIWNCVNGTLDADLARRWFPSDAKRLIREPRTGKLVNFMMQPAVQTLQAGFAANNYTTLVGGGPVEFLDMLDHGEGPLAQLGPGDVFVWVGITNQAWMHPWHSNKTSVLRDGLRKMTELGVLTVYYSSESFRHQPCSNKRSMFVREIWEYTRSNVLCCPDDPGALRVRYVPPGYTPRRPAGGALKGKRLHNDQRKLAFMGSAASWYWMRHECLQSTMSELVVGWNLTEQRYSNECWRTTCERCNASTCPLTVSHLAEDDNQWDAVVQRHHIFLNVHKVCEWTVTSSNASCESFRLATLLSAGAEVFSEHCHPADEKEYEGLVRFQQLRSVTADVVDLSRRLAATDATTIRLAVQKRASQFAERFAPAAIFERAGIPALLAAHRAAATDAANISAAFQTVLRRRPEKLRARFPSIPSFCCLTDPECSVLQVLTSKQVRSNMTLLHEMQAQWKARPTKRASPLATETASWYNI